MEGKVCPVARYYIPMTASSVWWLCGGGVGVEDSRGCRERRGGRLGVVDGKDFGTEVDGVDKVKEEDKAENFLAGPLLQPI
jgi:hypothetical protein